MKPSHLLSFGLVCLLALLRTPSVNAQTCAQVCDSQLIPPIWYNTSSTVLLVQGPVISVFPVKHDGSIDPFIYTRLSLDDIGELTGSCATNIYYIAKAEEEGRLARKLDPKTACCDTHVTTRILPGGVEADLIVVNVTRPEWPEFYLVISVTVSAETVVLPMEGSEHTLGPYNISYEAGKPKIEVDIHNWPWRADEVGGDVWGNTFLQFFFPIYANLSKNGNFSGTDFGQDLIIDAHNDIVKFSFYFLKVTTLDGLDYYSPINDFAGDYLNFLSQPEMEFPAVMIVCDDLSKPVVPRYKHLFWDPTLSAVFAAPVTEEPPHTPKGKSNRAVAIGVGVSVGVVAAFILVFVAAFLMIPSFKALFVNPK